MIIGYARVSTDGQTLDAQHAALTAACCERVFAEKVSGAKTDRQQLAKAIAALAPGDTLVVCKLDRLARSTRDLLNTLAAIAEAGASFRSLGDPWCDTTSAQWQVDANRARRFSGVRAASDPCSNWRRSSSGSGSWC